ncbi:MAG: peptidylprolyl isomerase [Clostridia bacterium]|nr:peptidylprolyl isomerase [Clostridia bacterium]
MGYARAIEQGIELTKADYAAIDDQIDQIKATVAQQGIGYTDYLYLMQTNAETLEQIVTEEYTGALYFADLVKENYASAKHILVKYDDGVHTKDEASKLIADIKKELDGGADFDKLMNEKSEDGRLADGSLASPDGYTFTKGQMVPEFEAAAFALSEGKISDIVAVESEGYKGFHIVKKMPTNLTEVASALMQGTDAQANAIIEAEKVSLTHDVKVEETDKIGYYVEQYK